MADRTFNFSLSQLSTPVSQNECISGCFNQNLIDIVISFPQGLGRRCPAVADPSGLLSLLSASLFFRAFEQGIPDDGPVA